MRCADPVALQTFDALDALPDDAVALFPAASVDLFGSIAWYRTVLDHAMPDDARPCFALCRVAGRAAALLPLQHCRDGSLASLTTAYTCRYAPLLAGGLDAAAQRLVAGRFAALWRGAATTRLDSLAADDPALAIGLAGARAAGLWPLRFAHFGNWHEAVGGLGWPAYLAARPGALRETIRRKFKRETGRVFEVVTGPPGLDAGIAVFEQVYRRSWKQPEPFPDFNAALMRQAAARGMLRLGLLHLGGEPAAVQLWVIEGGRATVLKLAHDAARQSASPGTLLTALMLRRLLDEEGITEIDFGRGDDAYKRGWAAERRQRIGLLLANPRRLAGLAAAGRHKLGRARARLRGDAAA